MSEESTVVIDQKWFKLISDRIKDNGEFDSVDQYVNYALSEIFSENDDVQYTSDERSEIEKNLKDLGYL